MGWVWGGAGQAGGGGQCGAPAKCTEPLRAHAHTLPNPSAPALLAGQHLRCRDPIHVGVHWQLRLPLHHSPHRPLLHHTHPGPATRPGCAHGGWRAACGVGCVWGGGACFAVSQLTSLAPAPPCPPPPAFAALQAAPPPAPPAQARLRPPRTWLARWGCSAMSSTALIRWTTEPWGRSIVGLRRWVAGWVGRGRAGGGGQRAVPAHRVPPPAGTPFVLAPRPPPHPHTSSLRPPPDRRVGVL